MLLLLWVMLRLMMMMMKLLWMVVLRGGRMAHVTWGIHARRKLPGVVAHSVLLRWNSLLMLLHVIRALVHERRRETHGMLLISDMLACRRRMWRTRVTTMVESLVEIDRVPGAPGAR